jgi:hypothetical protein
MKQDRILWKGRANMNTPNQPFWKDEPELQSVKIHSSLMPFFKIYNVFLLIFFVSIPAVFLSLVSTYLGLAWLVLMLGIYALSLYMRRYRKNFVNNIDETQKHAKEIIGASQIGSAIHVAGHPLLQREQQIVLALVGDQLNIYSYENATPLDSIPLKNVQGVFTVSYDDERVPHIDAIDGVAQALQLTFLWREQPCTCLFRKMKKLKPIDWYHTIQQVRLQSGLAK